MEMTRPNRWAEGNGGDVVDARLGELFRNVRVPAELSAVELGGVAARLRARPTSRTSALRYAALLVTGMFAGTGFAVASYGVQRLIDEPRTAPPVATPAPAAPSPAPKVASHRPAVETAPAATEQAPSRSAPASAPAAAPETSSSALGRESELLSRALAKLRRDRDANAALALLDRHAREFPSGALRLEADVARVDALLALGRRADALALLERLPIDRLGRGAELRVVRGELRAQRDPAGAAADFDHALRSDLGADLAERALFGRAGARLRLGDETRGRADLEAYLARFPNGRFAADAKRRLE